MSQVGDDRPPPSPRKVKKQVPQKTVDDFWTAFSTKFPGKVHSIIPNNAYAKSKKKGQPKGTVYGQGTHQSYEEAKADCVSTVEMIAKECNRVNMRYRDPHFDIEFDLKSGKRDCLNGLLVYPDAGRPKSVKRVHQIFENPQFYIDGATSGDVRQGRSGDCWFLAALGALGNKKGLIDRVCVAREEKVGVYGFVFHRDGEWIHTVIDDKLYLSVPDWDESLYEKVNWLQIPNRQDAEEEYRKVYQTGSRALYFAQCNTENETWLPLLEKAFAKAHGDYYSIDGGFTGEAIEDLTGGVTTEMFTSDILDTDKFWNDELKKVNDEFLFGCATGRFDDWQGGGSLTDRKGIQSGHAYSIMEAQEIKGERLLRVRNPWGETEWNGAWSDGSEQWTPEWMKLLDHRFGNDGVFWISYKDLLRKYQFFDRTRLFGKDWQVTQQWTTIDVPWTADYNDTKFSFTLSKQTPIVIVLSQLDDRYWDGLQGQYNFSLHFRVSKNGEEGYIVRSHGNYSMTRSVSTELELEAGTYSVLMKVTAKRYQGRLTVDDVIRMNCKLRQEKLLQIGLSYDLGHAKGLITETEEEKQAKAEQEAKAEATAKAKAREEAKQRKYQDWLREKKRVERNKREKRRIEEHRRKKAGKKTDGPRKTAKTGDPGNDIDERDGPENSVEKRTDDHESEIDKLPASDTQPKESDSEATPMADISTSDAEDGLVTPPTEKEHDGTPPSDLAADARAGEDAIPTPNSGNEAGDKPGIVAMQANLESIQSQPNNDLTTQEKIDKFNADPILKSPVPAIQVNDKDIPDAKVEQTPPPSPGFLDLPADAEDEDTVITYASSIDTDLDERYFEVPDDDVEVIEENEDEDEDLSDFSNDPWNAVCVVGLRLYTREGDISVDVVRPKVGDLEDETPLDLDDPSKGMSDEPLSPTTRGPVSMVTKLEDEVEAARPNAAVENGS